MSWYSRLALMGALAGSLAACTLEDDVTPTPQPAPEGGLPVLATDSSVHSSVASGERARYRVETTIDGAYTIRLDGLESDLGWQLFSDADFSATLRDCNDYTDTTAEFCPTPDLAGAPDYYLEVTNWGSATSLYDMVLAAPGGGLGNPTLPIMLTVGTAHQGQVGPDGTSYYQFQTADAGNYVISLNSTVGIVRRLYSEPDFSGSNAIWFTLGITGYGSPSLASSRTYYLAVASLGLEGTYDLTITRGQSAGTPEEPVDMGDGSAIATEVDASSSSYYRFSPTADGQFKLRWAQGQQQPKWELYRSDPAGAVLQESWNWRETDLVCPFQTKLTAGTVYVLGVRNPTDTPRSDSLSVLTGPELSTDAANPILLATNESAHCNRDLWAARDAFASSRHRYAFVVTAASHTLTYDLGNTHVVNLYNPDAYRALFPSPAVCERPVLDDPYCTISGLTIGTTYSFFVEATSSTASEPAYHIFRLR